MNIITKLEEIIKKVIDLGYWTLPIPSDVDSEIIDCIEIYKTLSKELKMSFKNNVTNDIARLLLYFSERMATLSLRRKDQAIFETGLYALDAIIGKIDNREILVIISLYYDVKVKHNLAFDEIINQEAPITELVQSFINRKDEDKAIIAMGYFVETNEANEVSYKRTW